MDAIPTFFCVLAAVNAALSVALARVLAARGYSFWGLALGGLVFSHLPLLLGVVLLPARGEWRRCRTCGTRLAAHETHCPGCGALHPLPPPAAAPATPPPAA